MRVRGLGITATMHNGHIAFFVEALEPGHAGTKSELVINLAQPGRPYPNLRAQTIVGIIGVGHERIKAVVGAGQLQHNQNALTVAADRFGDIRRVRCLRHTERQIGRHAGTGQCLQETTTGEIGLMMIRHRGAYPS